MAVAAAAFLGSLDAGQLAIAKVPFVPFDLSDTRREWSYLLIEHDNTQGGGKHIHSVWRDPDNDFGDDILAAHYRAEH
jgi:Protein of unknown function (DUF3500)